MIAKWSMTAFAVFLLSAAVVDGSAQAQTIDLPAVVDKVMQRPAPEQLDESDRAAFAQMAPDSDAARRFLYTRVYYRYCRLVTELKVPASSLPLLPSDENLDERYLSPAEIRTIEVAFRLFARDAVSRE